ncbi:WS/DGAT/MGAT family O-acyltransferase [Geodermatophilus sabuli]|uniref:Diacylglycerol O-acyltransferase n=1 Tax=Geodermatophilus sabuli TaxID=1564158 RepID=A0A285EJS5_9ACTN|nr:wax ester/triacylglycerol synthase family O-acyltransferase [Geodermatophilus sabuli]MBB3086084.1 WS/DGAT/MGAT family acyltransferase [Geodermatophilus sabuli]SNX98424.1 acyltransferase, WS/DGAT/MGAT [Geodermatophilus sabuli]
MERLTTLDASFLYLERPDSPMHVAGVLVLEPPPGGLEAIAALVEARLPLVPRYRQRVLEVPGHLADPVWADDPDFDADYHVRRSAVPRPGTEAQLLDLVSRVTARPLDRSRPLWELYLVEGLADDRVAVVTKTHPALIDGLGAVDIGQVLLDPSPDAPLPAPEPWRPHRLPTALQLALEAVGEYVARPTAVVDTARQAVADLRATGARLGSAVGGMVRATRSALWAAPHSPLNATNGSQRRVAVARADLDDVKKVRKAHGGTVNDVLLAVVAGALRDWLLSRGQAVLGSTSIRAMVPVSVQGEEEEAPGTRVSSYLVDLPVGEANPRMRLARISYAMRGVDQHGRSVGAETLIALTGFAPPTLHALGARAARGLSRRMSNLVITNVPGPQLPLYAAGSRMLEVFPVVPLAPGQGLSVGITSYDGRIFFGLNADRDSVGDVDVLADLLEQELGTLVETAG